MAQETTIETSTELVVSLKEKLDKIRSPKLEGQQKNAAVLAGVEEVLKQTKSQKTEFSPTDYFSALLLLLRTTIPNDGAVNKETATSVIYLIDLVAPYTPQPLLQTQFSQILTNVATALTLPEADAPLLRPSIGCLETLLIAQDSAAWEMSQNQVGPRRAMAGLLNLALDHRPKIRKRAQEALSKILANPPPSPALDHSAADMCAETALRALEELAEKSNQAKKQRKAAAQVENEPSLIHALQLVRAVAAATKGWPSKKIEKLCDVLLGIARSSNEYMTMTAFDVFEIIFAGMAADSSSAKLPRLLEAISELQPQQNDTQLLPPWIAVLSRAYDVSAQLEPEETFQKLPELFTMITSFLTSSSHNIRISASECLISFMANCIPGTVILEPSIYDEKVLEKLGKAAIDLLSVKYQAAWMEVFHVLGAMFDGLRWKSDPILNNIIRTIGELRSSDSFTGKKEADEVLGKAIRAIGPEAVLHIIPLNLAGGQPGRAWLLPILRDYISNTNLEHFKTEFLPLSDKMFQKVLDHGELEKTMEIKIFEAVFHQIWALLSGYCNMPLDVTQSFDGPFVERLAFMLSQKIKPQSDICRALQNLVDSNKAIVESEEVEEILLQSRISKSVAQANLDHLAAHAANVLAMLFNVYSETLPQNRSYILQSINAYLSITSAQELTATFERVTVALASSLEESAAQAQVEKQKQKKEDRMPPMSHTLMDLVITISIYLPRESFGTLFEICSRIIVKNDDPQLQKKAYKLIPRLAGSPIGKIALKERNAELQQLLLNSAEKVSAPAKGDRLAAIAALVPFLPDDALHFIPCVMSEVVVSCKAVNERARTAAFDLLVLMGERIVASPNALIQRNKLPYMPADAPAMSATIEEYFDIVSAGLAGGTPHMISASINAFTRILHHFRQSLSLDFITNMIDTINEFLLSKNREIVQSVLGFVKECVVSLPKEMMRIRLQTLIPNLIVWSHEHKAHFQVKVKSIIDRMIRRFTFEEVYKYTPEEDRKLITNIRKTKERKKRHKDAAKAGEGSDDEEGKGKRKPRFDNEYDEVMYGSDASATDSDASDNDVPEKRSGKGGKKGGSTYIVEDEEEPLDLLDRKSLAHISSTKPQSQQRKNTKKTKAKFDEDGKLILGGVNGDDDAMVIDDPAANNGEDDTGVGAYVHAISGKDAVKRGQNGRLKFSNKKGQDEMDDEMNVDEDDVKKVKKAIIDGKGRNGKVGIAAGRRGLGEQKRSGGGGGGGGASSGRVMKSPRGRGGGGRGGGRGGRGGGGFRG